MAAAATLYFAALCVVCLVVIVIGVLLLLGYVSPKPRYDLVEYINLVHEKGPCSLEARKYIDDRSDDHEFVRRAVAFNALLANMKKMAQAECRCGGKCGCK